MLSDIVNYRNTTQKVYVTTELEYSPGTVEGNLETSVQVVSIGMCEGQNFAFTPPPGQKKFKISGKEMVMAKNGYLITSVGHLHDGGVDLMLKVNGKEVCQSRAAYGTAGPTPAKGMGHGHQRRDQSEEYKTISEMSYCYGPNKVSKGDKIELEARYDLEMHPPRVQHGGNMAEEMAIFATFFAELPDGKN
jgi:hypothetical protein